MLCRKVLSPYKDINKGSPEMSNTKPFTATTASKDSNIMAQSDNSTAASANNSATMTTPISTIVSATNTSNITSNPVTSSSVTSTKYQSTAIIQTTVITANTSSSSNDSSTTVPSVTTQSNNVSSSITVTISDSPGTVPSVTFSSVTSSKTSNPNPDNTTGCEEDSCSGGASCVSLNNTSFCLCVDGYYYNSSKCNKGKLFPGTITLSVTEISGLQDAHSIAYEKLYLKVTTFFKDAFVNTDYGQTVINKVRISPSARSEFRAGQEDVAVTVVNLFSETTKEDETSVTAIIDNAVKGNSDGIAKYDGKSLCDFYGCVAADEKDDCSNGLLCTCKEGLERPNPQIALCVASCPDNCNAENNKQCLMDGEVAKCTCLPGYKQKDDGICQACAFGYGGVNCEDYFQLILIIVGIVAGGLILAMMIALILVSSKKKKNTIEEQNLIKNDFQNLRLQETTGFSNLGAEGSIFPKIRTNFSRENQLQNPYENQRGIPHPDY
ncbi:mucin-13 [Pteropus vampyrus]|uniref:Mucin-13 n=1 Tax=Pteropus vampyrus TaxID=132908 RepID=A0A6P3PXQ6_PTEVA|nr:mucin-13 [Pteropus vampyrus]